MLRLLFCALFASSLPLLHAQNCSQDQLNTIQQCYLTYLKTYGFDNVIPAYNLYDDALQPYRNRGWNGELYICKTGQILVSCVGEENQACMTVENFSSFSGLTGESNMEYVIDFKEIQYRCYGDGFQEYKDVYYCMANWEDCPGNPGTCDEIVPYIQCMENAAYKVCGGEGRDFVCNVFDITAQVWLNCDNLPKCSKNQTETPSFSPLKKILKLF